MSFKNILIRVVEADTTDRGPAPAGSFKFNNPIKANDLMELVEILLEAVAKIGAAIVVFMIIYSGFLFVKAQGDPGELEKAKKTFLWTVIGGVVLIGAAAIAAMVKSTARELGVEI